MRNAEATLAVTLSRVSTTGEPDDLETVMSGSGVAVGRVIFPPTIIAYGTVRSGLDGKKPRRRCKRVVNTILNQLSNSTMIAIAKSLKPVR